MSSFDINEKCHTIYNHTYEDSLELHIFWEMNQSLFAHHQIHMVQSIDSYDNLDITCFFAGLA